METRHLNPRPAAAPLPGGIDWSQPWLAQLRPHAPLIDAHDPRQALTQRASELHVQNAAGMPIRFVAADDADGQAYEAHIAETGRVPTRLNLHDLFNALVWLTYPRAKAALNALQSRELAQKGVSGSRGPVRDAATLIDESAVLLASDDPAIAAALHGLDWHTALVASRSRWGSDIIAVPFGHALIEKLVSPYKAVTALVVDLPRTAGSNAAIDAALAQRLVAEDLAPRLFAHLPVLGIPGWWAANADPSFYDDAAVFRCRRRAA